MEGFSEHEHITKVVSLSKFECEYLVLVVYPEASFVIVYIAAPILVHFSKKQSNNYVSLC